MIESHADDLDHANELAQHAIYLGIQAARNALANTGEKPEYDNDGQRICIDCESVIPPERIQINSNVVRCVHCQRELEVENKIFGGRHHHA